MSHLVGVELKQQSQPAEPQPSVPASRKITTAWHHEKLQRINFFKDQPGDGRERLGTPRAECLGEIWSNVHFLGCTYPESVMMQIKDWGSPDFETYNRSITPVMSPVLPEDNADIMAGLKALDEPEDEPDVYSRALRPHHSLVPQNQSQPARNTQKESDNSNYSSEANERMQRPQPHTGVIPMETIFEEPGSRSSSVMNTPVSNGLAGSPQVFSPAIERNDSVRAPNVRRDNSSPARQYQQINSPVQPPQQKKWIARKQKTASESSDLLTPHSIDQRQHKQQQQQRDDNNNKLLGLLTPESVVTTREKPQNNTSTSNLLLTPQSIKFSQGAGGIGTGQVAPSRRHDEQKERVNAQTLLEKVVSEENVPVQRVQSQPQPVLPPPSHFDRQTYQPPLPSSQHEVQPQPQYYQNNVQQPPPQGNQQHPQIAMSSLQKQLENMIVESARKRLRSPGENDVVDDGKFAQPTAAAAAVVSRPYKYNKVPPPNAPPPSVGQFQPPQPQHTIPAPSPYFPPAAPGFFPPGYSSWYFPPQPFSYISSPPSVPGSAAGEIPVEQLDPKHALSREQYRRYLIHKIQTDDDFFLPLYGGYQESLNLGAFE